MISLTNDWPEISHTAQVLNILLCERVKMLKERKNNSHFAYFFSCFYLY